MSGYLILGCGYTASRVAHLLVASGERVICTNRQIANIPGADNIALYTDDPSGLSQLEAHLTGSLIVLNSVSATSSTDKLLHALRPFDPQRFVYISTTGVYGAAELVDEGTIPCPNTDRDAARLNTENQIAAGPWSSLILRPAAIYGPGRGVHTSAHTGVFKPPPGGNRIISRIHVDDLADHVLAGLRSQLTGAFPVADEEPCPSLEVAEFAFQQMNRPFTTAEREATPRDERKSGRRVDGSAYRKTANLHLRYRTYREGVPACLAAEDLSPR